MEPAYGKVKVGKWEKLKLLLWKNWLLQWHHKKATIFELVLPALFVLLLVWWRWLLKPQTLDVQIFRPQEIDNLEIFVEKFLIAQQIKEQDGKAHSNSTGANELVLKLAYSPTNSRLEAIIKIAAEKLGLYGYKSYANAAALEDAFSTENMFAGIQFDDSWATITDYPRKFAYSLRFPSALRTSTENENWLTSNLFPLSDEQGPRNSEDPDGGLPVGYLREGFIPVQHAVSMAYLQLASNGKTLPKVDMQRFPYPKYVNDPMLDSMVLLMPLLLVISFIYPCTALTKCISLEKGNQLKEVMKIMGLSNWLHWTAWFTKSFIMLGITIVLILLLIKIPISSAGAVLPSSDWSVVLVFFLIYTIASICFCFMMATFFKKANTAAAVTGLLWFLTFLPTLIGDKYYASMSLSTKLSWCLFSNTAMGFGFTEIIAHEINCGGLQWSNLFKTVSVDANFTVGATILMLLADSVLYMIICLYVEQIMPGDFGIPQKWYFPVMPSFWCPPKDYPGIEDMSSTNGAIERKVPDAFEPEPAGKHAGIKVINLKKRFGKKYVVKGITVRMYEDEIMVLLGHNGAGKTTTISMLTGTFPPTTGTAIINGYDIRKNIEAARQSLGICPQHNVLFDDMSCANHIVFYSRLKGLKGAEVKREVDKYLKMIELENKANVESSKLSGGMKRKLSVCCALCGGTKVVLCDEPSSGLDPAARRQLWDLLQAEKSGRTILLTTHFMDEADVLGDRIAIMCDGELKCHGTSFFLKKKYGSGYHLICVKSEGCNSEAVTALLSKYIPGIRPEADIGAELSYQLPDSHSSKFERMFRDLESNSASLRLEGYGVGITSMEEVFMKVGAENAESDTEEVQMVSKQGDEDIELKRANSMFSENTRLLRGAALYCNQWQAMLLKKCLYTLRNKFLFAIQNILALFFVLLALLNSRTSVVYRTLEPMKIDLNQYPDTFTVLEKANDVAPGSSEARIADEYKNFIDSYDDKHQLQTTGAKSFQKFILDLGATEQARINTHCMAAATVSAGKITAWLNNQPLHTAPLTLNFVHNAMARVFIDPEASITITNAPLPYSLDMKFKQLKQGNSLGTQMAANIVISMSFITALYILFIIRERETRSKLLQFVGGVRVLTFWLSQLLWDMITFLVTALVVIIILACFQAKGYATFDELLRHLILLVMFGMSALLFTYLISFCFSEAATGYARLTIINIFAGVVLFAFAFTILSFAFPLKKYGEYLEIAGSFFPHFLLAMGWHRLYTNWFTRDNCNRISIQNLPEALRCEFYPQCCSIQPYFSTEKPGIMREIEYLAIIAVICFLIIIILEYGVVGKLIAWCRRKIFKPKPDDGSVDDDVENEKKRVLTMSKSELAQQNLVLSGVTKYFCRYLAVNQVSLCVKENECFGLLGVNGAGKTTTFKMMTGDETITYGNAYIKGTSLTTKMNKIYQDIGYCPQFDALFDDMTGRETLRIFCLIRGVHPKRIKRIIEDLAKSFGFAKHLDKPTKAYSGGNKRKLSTAIAVIGSPSVIYLDEPTTGMDPAARRQLWNVICSIRDSGKSIILTSHSMEECEALCTRLAIMVNGDFKCIGSTQHLKNKFSKGLILKLKVRRTQDTASSPSNRSNSRSQSFSNVQHIQKVKDFVDKNFPHAVLKEEYQGVLTFYIPLSGIKWSSIFGVMENNRHSLNIEDYSISQTTLEEIFLEFAKYQRADPRDNEKNRRCKCC